MAMMVDHVSTMAIGDTTFLVWHSCAERQIDPELLLETLQAHLINEGGDLLDGVGSPGEVPGGVAVLVSQSQVGNHQLVTFKLLGGRILLFLLILPWLVLIDKITYCNVDVARVSEAQSASWPSWSLPLSSCPPPRPCPPPLCLMTSMTPPAPQAWPPGPPSLPQCSPQASQAWQPWQRSPAPWPGGAPRLQTEAAHWEAMIYEHLSLPCLQALILAACSARNLAEMLPSVLWWMSERTGSLSYRLRLRDPVLGLTSPSSGITTMGYQVITVQLI